MNNIFCEILFDNIVFHNILPNRLSWRNFQNIGFCLYSCKKNSKDYSVGNNF